MYLSVGYQDRIRGEAIGFCGRRLKRLIVRQRLLYQHQSSSSGSHLHVLKARHLNSFCVCYSDRYLELKCKCTCISPAFNSTYMCVHVHVCNPYHMYQFFTGFLKLKLFYTDQMEPQSRKRPKEKDDAI